MNNVPLAVFLGPDFGLFGPVIGGLIGVFVGIVCGLVVGLRRRNYRSAKMAFLGGSILGGAAGIGGNLFGGLTNGSQAFFGMLIGAILGGIVGAAVLVGATRSQDDS